MKLLLLTRVDVDGRDLDFGSGEAPLSCAAWAGQFEAVNVLLDAGADPDIACCAEATALNAAAHQGHVAVVRLLVERGADPNAGWAIGIAAQRGDAEMVAVLMKAGAKRRNGIDGRLDALNMARAGQHKAIVRILEGYDP